MKKGENRRRDFKSCGADLDTTRESAQWETIVLSGVSEWVMLAPKLTGGRTRGF